MRNHLTLTRAAIAGWCLVACTVSASAGISNTVFNIVATNAQGTASYQATFNQGSINAQGIFTWTLPGSVDLFDDEGDLIATLNSAGTTIRTIPIGNFGYQIAVNYQLTSGDGGVDPNSVTTFEITSALLDFPTLTDPNMRATLVAGVTDQSQGSGANGVWMKGAHPDQSIGKYNYNGLAPAGTNYASLLSQVTGGPGSGGNGNQSQPPSGFTQVPGFVQSMSLQTRFTLTAGDSGTGTAQFIIVPEPATLAMLTLAGLALARRR